MEAPLPATGAIGAGLAANARERAELFERYSKESEALLGKAIDIVTKGGGAAVSGGAPTPAVTAPSTVPDLKVAPLSETYKLERLVGGTNVAPEDIRAIAAKYRDELKKTFDAIAVRELTKRVKELEQRARDTKAFIDTTTAVVNEGEARAREQIQRFLDAIEGIINDKSVRSYSGLDEVVVSREFGSGTTAEYLATLGDGKVTLLKARFDAAFGAIKRAIDTALENANRSRVVNDVSQQNLDAMRAQLDQAVALGRELERQREAAVAQLAQLTASFNEHLKAEAGKSAGAEGAANAAIARAELAEAQLARVTAESNEARAALASTTAERDALKGELASERARAAAAARNTEQELLNARATANAVYESLREYQRETAAAIAAYAGSRGALAYLLQLANAGTVTTEPATRAALGDLVRALDALATSTRGRAPPTGAPAVSDPAAPPGDTEGGGSAKKPAAGSGEKPATK